MSNTPYNLELITGPCSITHENVQEIIHEIAEIKVNGQKAIHGTRVVGLKSRTALNPSGEGMGIDIKAINQAIIASEDELAEITLPSIELAEQIVKQTGMKVGLEVMLPHVQLPFYERSEILKNNLLIWNPAVVQLGWITMELGKYAARNGWDIGIKNSKFLGREQLHEANHPDFTGETSLEKTWKGLTTFIPTEIKSPILIHRGVDVPRNDDFRNALAHEIARRVKEQIPGARLYLDPSHSYGPKLRDKIVSGTIEAMKMKHGDRFLYDGALIEVGTSPSDTHQHITTKELKELAEAVSEFRILRKPAE